MADFELDDFDFGFTAVSEDAFNATEEQLQAVAKSAGYNKAAAVYDAILPLLNNLAKDADKNAYIHWPNRLEKIEAFKTKLRAIVNG